MAGVCQQCGLSILKRRGNAAREDCSGNAASKGQGDTKPGK